MDLDTFACSLLYVELAEGNSKILIFTENSEIWSTSASFILEEKMSFW